MGEEKERIRISGLSFINILKTGQGRIIEGETIVDGDFLEKEVIRIENARILQQVDLPQLSNLTKTIELVNVLFDYGIQFRPGTTIKSLIFSKCAVNDRVLLERVTITERFGVFDTVCSNNLELDFCKFKELHLDGIQCQMLELRKGSYESFMLSNSTVHGLTFPEASIKEAYIENECRIDNIGCLASTFNRLAINYSTINKASLSLSRFDYFSMNLSEIKEDMGFEMSVVSEGLKVDTSTIKEFRLGISHFKNARLSTNTIQSLKINTEIPKDSILVVDDCTIERLQFDSMKNSGSLRLLHIVSPSSSELSILNSDLGKTDFIRCNFDKAVFHFTNSKIAESFLAETDFPKRIFSEAKPNHHQAQLAFGQLQTAYQRQGDNIRASEYQAREIEAHYKTLPWSRKNFFTKLNLFFNRISNNFGRNWAQGAVFSVAAGLIFFYFLVLSSEEFHFAFKLRSDLFDSFLKFMNPLRHFDTETLFSDKIPQVTPNNWSYLWDFAGRIFVAYGYYQTIQAFRRFGKK